ncbi:glycosyltransferase [Methylobacterium sp. P31]
MIVKDEAHVILRCLATVRPVIDHWIIVGTGSTDGTQNVIRSAMADLPGTLVERPWVDFAFNRSEALTLARPHGTYTLIIDADDELNITKDCSMPELVAPAYYLKIIDGFTQYTRIQLVNNDLEWRYRGVLHEFLDCKDAFLASPISLSMRRGDDGAPHRDPTTYARDASILENALATETDPLLISRYTYYLAQSYRDSGEPRRALEYYLRRCETRILGRGNIYQFH